MRYKLKSLWLIRIHNCNKTLQWFSNYGLCNLEGYTWTRLPRSKALLDAEILQEVIDSVKSPSTM